MAYGIIDYCCNFDDDDYSEYNAINAVIATRHCDNIDEIFTLKDFTSRAMNCHPTQVTESQKWSIRYSKHPQRVLVITRELPEDKAKSNKALDVAAVWAERVPDVRIIELSGNMTSFTYNECKPWETQQQEPLSITADRYIKSTGYDIMLTAPLHRDYLAGSEIDTMALKRPHWQCLEDIQYTATNHSFKHWKQAHAYASAKEIEAFESYYAFISPYKAEFLEIGYQICPGCGEPIKIDKAQFNCTEIKSIAHFKKLTDKIPVSEKDYQCAECGFRIPAQLIIQHSKYWDDSYKDEEEE